jgi:hypothetical protein
MKEAARLLEWVGVAACIFAAVVIAVTFFVHPAPEWVMPAFFASIAAAVISWALGALTSLLSASGGSVAPPTEARSVPPRLPVETRLTMHVYRDATAAETRARQLLGAIFIVGVVVSFMVASIIDSFNDGFSLGDALFAAVWAVAGLLLVRGVYRRYYYYGVCEEIRLSNDGTCELEARRTVVRLHVNEIKAVKYRCSDEDDGESYTIRFTGGKLEVGDGMADFPDFLARLERLNPAVELTSFPAGAWRREAPPPARSGGSISRSTRSGLFPLVVLGALVWLALHTLGS